MTIGEGERIEEFEDLKCSASQKSLLAKDKSMAECFVRGTSSDSIYKPCVFKGHAADGTDTIHTYFQQTWIKGRYITDLLKEIKFIYKI